MKLWVLSDLHQEFVFSREYGRNPHTAFDPAAHAPDEFDVVVCAGDISVPLTASLYWMADRFRGVPIVAVAGNHDFYSSEGSPFTLPEMRERGRDLAAELRIHLLDDTAVEIGGVRFLGGTLWTDFNLGAGLPAGHVAEARGRQGMNDYRRIKRWSTKHPGQRRPLRPEDTIALHRRTRAFLEQTLADPFDGPTVVVTHHAPHRQSLDASQRGRLDWCYASDLSSLMTGPTAPDLWLHGHIHRSVDYVVGGTRVVSNPRGYAFEPGERARSGFDPGLVLEVDDHGYRPPTP